MHSILRLPKAMDFPRCNIADIDCYIKMSTDPPPVDPKVEMLSELCQEEDATLKPTLLTVGNWIPH